MPSQSGEKWVRLTPFWFHLFLGFARARLWTHAGAGSTCFTMGRFIFWNDYPEA